jgi:flagellar hook-associated protein 3 FlgL
VITRVGTFDRFQRTNMFMQQSTVRLATLQDQLSSGKKAEFYSGFGGVSGRLVSLQSESVRTEKFESVNTQIGSKLTQMDIHMSSLLDAAIAFKVDLISARNIGNSSSAGLLYNADQRLQQAASTLNATSAGEYLFGGSRIDAPPVDLSLFTALPSAIVADSSYYKGDNQILFAQIDKNFRLDYGINADNPAFEQYIRGLRIVKNAPTNDAAISQAIDLVSNAIDGIRVLVAANGIRLKATEDVSDQHNANNLVLKDTIGSLVDTDFLDVTTRLQLEQTNLQAQFTYIGKFSNLSLAQYLN